MNTKDKIKEINSDLITLAIENGLESFLEKIPERIRINIAICETRKQNPRKNSYQRIANYFGMSLWTVRDICKACL